MRVECLILLVFTAVAAGQEWKASPSSVAIVNGTKFGWRVPQGKFSAREIDGKSQPGLTARLNLTVTPDTIVLHGINGNIWSETAEVPFPPLMEILNSPGLLYFKRYPRIHLSASAAEIQPRGAGVFLVHAKVDVKDQQDIPVDFEVQLERTGSGIRFSLHSVHSTLDGEGQGTVVSRKRLNLGGAPWLVDDGVSLAGEGELQPSTGADAPEPGDEFPTSETSHRHARTPAGAHE